MTLADIRDYVLARAKEPSTWAGIAAVLTLTGQQFPSVQHTCTLLGAYAGLAAMWLRENPQ